MTDYLTFEEAASMLNVAHSTLYRWLREERVPGHKVGRQWRFVRSELEDFMVDDGSSRLEALKPLITYLQSGSQKEPTMEIQNVTSPSKLAEDLLWDAVDRGATVMHLQPTGGGHRLRYRIAGGLDTIVDLDDGAFDVLDESWRGRSTAVRSADHRHLFLERSSGDGTERVQVRYQRLHTLIGDRVTLRLLREESTNISIEDIADGADVQRLQEVCDSGHGLVLISGRGGSGKTTTVYACLAELARAGKVVFTIEESAGYFIDGVNQIEIPVGDVNAYGEAFAGIYESDLDVLFVSSPFAHSDRDLLWNGALRTAESGHLVLVQMEAESAEDAVQKFNAVVDRPAKDYLLASLWQELDVNEQGRRFARYDWRL
jgi:general secretion pathway protein E